MSRPSSRAVAAFLLGLTLAAAQTAAAAVEAGKPVPAPTPAPAATPAPAPASAPATAPAVAPATPGAVEQPAVPVPPPAGLLVPGSEFRYDATGRRDPFKSLLQLEKKQRDPSLLPPIQQFDLNAAKVVGVIVDPVRGAQAMVRAPGGQTFVVRVGTIIGKNEGEVVEITMNGVRIVEKFLDFMNRETREETFLKSHPTAGK